MSSMGRESVVLTDIVVTGDLIGAVNVWVGTKNSSNSAFPMY